MSEKTKEKISNMIETDLKMSILEVENNVCSGNTVVCGHIILNNGKMAEVTLRVNTLIQEWEDEDYKIEYLMTKHKDEIVDKRRQI
jgi:hypothetical protein